MKNTNSTLKYCSWNIAGFNDKNNSIDFITYIIQFDIVFLSEIKSSRPISLPGFSVAAQCSENGHGGVALLIKHYLQNQIKILFQSSNVIAFQHSNLPETIFIGAYIEPADSKYYDPQCFGIIQSFMLKYSNVLFFGDLNSHVTPGKINSHGNITLSLMKDADLLILNKIPPLPQDLTFRKKKEWKTQVDFLMVSKHVFCHINNFIVNQNLQLPSDHSPLEWNFKHFDFNDLLLRASDLGKNSFVKSSAKHISRKIKIQNINWEVFNENLNKNDWFSNNPDIDTLTKNITNIISSNIQHSRIYNEECNFEIENSPDSRWRNVLATKDYRIIWKSIDWNGNIKNSNFNELRPSANEFKEHFDILLNTEPPIELNENVYLNPLPCIPILDDDFTLMELDIVT